MGFCIERFRPLPLTLAMCATFLAACDSDSRTDGQEAVRTSRPAGEQPTSSTPSAVVRGTASQACEDLLDSLRREGQSLPHSVDARDFEQARAMQAADPRDIRLIGETRCGSAAGISVGVASDRVKIPSRGDFGTPFIVFVQPEINAL